MHGPVKPGQRLENGSVAIQKVEIHCVPPYRLITAVADFRGQRLQQFFRGAHVRAAQTFKLNTRLLKSIHRECELLVRFDWSKAVEVNVIVAVKSQFST